MKLLKISMLLIFLFIAVTFVFADNCNNQIDDELYQSLQNSECSSIILQVSENESVASFRRDEVQSADIFIVNKTWGNLTVLEQYKHRGGDFFQAVITENGWVIGCGGQSDGMMNHQIKNISSKIVTEENISKYIYKIQDILSNYENGHFVVKDPQGNYVVIFTDSIKEGKLNSGEYICVGNMHQWFNKGYFDFSPVDTSIKIASKDRYGLERRNIMTYDYVKNNPDDICVDIYATNDDGSFVGQDCQELSDNVDYDNNYILSKDIPKTPNKLKIGQFIFKKSNSKFLGLF